MKAVILAGGHGKRLRPLTQDRPKALVEVGGRPIIEWQIRWLSSHGVKEFVVCAGYMKEKFFSVIGSGSKLGVKVYYSVEDEPLGTGGALKNAEGLLMNESGFLTVNGDIITSLNPTALVEQGSVGVVSLVPLKSPYGVVELLDNGLVKGFLEKPQLDYWVNAGVYYFKPEIFQYLPEKGDLEKTTFPELAKKNMLKAVKFKDVFWRAIDTQKDVEEVEKELLQQTQATKADISYAGQ
jgi:mannose-1-phosphate guanylyltransferase